MEIPTTVATAGMIVHVGGPTAVAREKVYANAKKFSTKLGVAQQVIAVSCQKKEKKQTGK